jgi:hypothetical protein
MLLPFLESYGSFSRAPMVVCTHRWHRIAVIMRHAKAAFGCVTASVCIASCVHAAEIHKCTGDGPVAYQTTPCGAAQTELAVLQTPDVRTRAEAAESTTSRMSTSGARDAAQWVDAPNASRGTRWLPFRRKGIATGMTDDEVLNTPNGGVPTTISRSREGRVWRERWTYALRDGTFRELEFVNGTLTNIVDDANGPTSLRLAVAQ